MEDRDHGESSTLSTPYNVSSRCSASSISKLDPVGNKLKNRTK